jgi:hypothetical protein
MFQEEKGMVAPDSLGDSSGQIANVYWSYPGLFSKSAPRISGQDDSYIDFPAQAAQFGVKDFTIAFWVSTAETLQLFDLIGNRTAGSHGNFVSIRMTGSDGAPPGQITAEIDEDGNGKNYAFLQSTTTGLNDGQWHYVVLVREGPALHLFVDGFLEDSKTAAGIADLNNGNPLRIGRSVRSAALRFAPMATFDSVEIFDSAAPPAVLSRGEFALLAAALQPPLQGQLDALIKGLKVAVIRRQAFTSKLAEVEIDLHRSQAKDDKTSAIGAAVAVGGGALLAISLVALLLAPATGGASLALEEAGLAAEAASLTAEGATLTAESAWAGAPASMAQGGIFAGGGLQLGGKIAATIGTQMSADESEAATKDVQARLQEEDVFLQNLSALNDEFQRQLEIAYAGLQASWPGDHEGETIPTLDEFFKLVRAVRHIPQSDVNEVQLWLQRGGHIVSTGLFVAGSLDRVIRGVLTAWGAICTLAGLAGDAAKQVLRATKSAAFGPNRVTPTLGEIAAAADVAGEPVVASRAITAMDFEIEHAGWAAGLVGDIFYSSEAGALRTMLAIKLMTRVSLAGAVVGIAMDAVALVDALKRIAAGSWTEAALNIRRARVRNEGLTHDLIQFLGTLDAQLFGKAAYFLKHNATGKYLAGDTYPSRFGGDDHMLQLTDDDWEGHLNNSVLQWAGVAIEVVGERADALSAERCRIRGRHDALRQRISGAAAIVNNTQFPYRLALMPPPYPARSKFKFVATEASKDSGWISIIDASASNGDFITYEDQLANSLPAGIYAYVLDENNEDKQQFTIMLSESPGQVFVSNYGHLKSGDHYVVLDESTGSLRTVWAKPDEFQVFMMAGNRCIQHRASFKCIRPNQDGSLGLDVLPQQECQWEWGDADAGGARPLRNTLTSKYLGFDDAIVVYGDGSAADAARREAARTAPRLWDTPTPWRFEPIDA